MRKIFSFLVSLFPLIGFGQNLLLNGGFEDENICTEYTINCAPEAWISNPRVFSNYFKDSNRAYAGEHCMGIEAGHVTRPYQRTFIRSQLLCSLRKGNTYRLSFYIKSFHPILDSVGVYFGSLEPLMERKPIHLLGASLYLIDNPANHFTKDSSWQKVVLDYTAKGDEKYITISNFSRKDINGSTGLSRQNSFYIYLDNISLVPLDPNEGLCDNWRQMKEEIYGQNERHQYLDRILRMRNGDLNYTVKPSPTLFIKTDSLTLPDILFATAKRDLKPGSFAFLDSFCKSMAGKTIDSLVIDGHTDNTGTRVFNEQLSLGRAEAVADYLQHCTFFAKVPVTSRGLGSSQPVAPNTTTANRQRNRRVVLFVYFRERE